MHEWIGLLQSLVAYRNHVGQYGNSDLWWCAAAYIQANRTMQTVNFLLRQIK